MIRTSLALVFACLAAPQASQAEGLLGRTVVFTVEVWDDPQAPLLESGAYTARVGPGAEIEMTEEGWLGMNVVPVTIDISDSRVTFSYEGDWTGTFYPSAFNGYVMRFAGECALIERAKPVAEGSTQPVPAEAVSFGSQELRLNVAGLSHAPGERIEIALRVADCPVS
ncbi:hypothetical protein [Wenxinia saemankumensis]|uniref:Uncharacterized protein n=1 Tax=Wenxinia saemankumensis TaxID=1447782 RepID=A0A1M6GQF2_9RHOB|nr:hypothetical protein [Wenxinia saemankumensis]SHJ12179.1 hypothetical protein SAMN05444417_2859 [Wenxinia saemankumensis]